MGNINARILMLLGCIISSSSFVMTISVTLEIVDYCGMARGLLEYLLKHCLCAYNIYWCISWNINI